MVKTKDVSEDVYVNYVNEIQGDRKILNFETIDVETENDVDLNKVRNYS